MIKKNHFFPQEDSFIVGIVFPMTSQRSVQRQGGRAEALEHDNQQQMKQIS